MCAGVRGAAGPSSTGRVDPARDQSYFLFATTREQLDYPALSRSAGCEKPAVRRLAAELGLRAADKPDSQDICFVPEGRYATVVDRLRPRGALAGDIVHLDGRVLGRHEGVSRYTVGQRRGLDVAVGEPLFVVRLEPTARQVIVGPREALLARALRLKETNWLGDEASLEAAAEAGQPVLARVRSTREPAPARLKLGRRRRRGRVRDARGRRGAGPGLRPLRRRGALARAGRRLHRRLLGLIPRAKDGGGLPSTSAGAKSDRHSQPEPRPPCPPIPSSSSITPARRWAASRAR